jgi:hypothetical protein
MLFLFNSSAVIFSATQNSDISIMKQLCHLFYMVVNRGLLLLGMIMRYKCSAVAFYDRDGVSEDLA